MSYRGYPRFGINRGYLLEKTVSDYVNGKSVEVTIFVTAHPGAVQSQNPSADSTYRIFQGDAAVIDS